MTITVAALWRHPIKSHGRESLSTVSLTKGQTMPWDRRWAVAHEGAKSDGSEWAHCINYSRGAKVPALMAINAKVDEVAGTVSLSHPLRDTITIDPDAQADQFLEWIKPLMPEGRHQSVAIHRVPDRGMTDTPFPSISLINLNSNQSVADELAQQIDPRRWRCNVHFSGAPAWDELQWLGKQIRIGTCELIVREPIIRCLATTANPDTGERDADTLAALKRIGNHQNFGIYAEVLQSGDITVGDEIQVN